MAAPQPDPMLGQPIAGKYRLDRVLGSGGFGTVYAGVHEWTGRPVAAKVMDPLLANRADYVQRFLREARVAAKLSHPHVVDVLDMGRDEGGTVYLVLEYLEGEDLAQRLKRDKRLSIAQGLSILLPIMDALAEAHAAGIVHRDLKPANIFLSLDKRGREVPKLLDFGIAKEITADLSMTKTGQIWGTPHFMSPEQASGSRAIGPEADVWAMGVVLFRTLSGEMPFNATTPGEMVVKLLTERAPSIRSVMELPAPVADAIDRALTREQADRFPDMGMFFSALVGAARSHGLLPSSTAAMLDRRDLGSSETVVNAGSSDQDRDPDDHTTPKSADVVSGVMPVTDPGLVPRASQAPTDPHRRPEDAAPPPREESNPPFRPTEPMGIPVMDMPEDDAEDVPPAAPPGVSPPSGITALNPWLLGVLAALVALGVAAATVILVLSLASAPPIDTQSIVRVYTASL